MTLNAEQIINFNNARGEEPNEKSVEFKFYNLLHNYYSNKYYQKKFINIEYSCPFNTDGIITIKTFDYQYSILIEAKHHKNYKNKIQTGEVLAQAINYIKSLQDHNYLIPATILLIEQNSCVVVDTEHIIKYLNGKYDWTYPASDKTLNQELINDILTSTFKAKIFNYDNKKFDFNNMFNYIEEVSLNSNFKATMRNNYSPIEITPQITEDPINLFTLAEEIVDHYQLIFKSSTRKYYTKKENDYIAVNIWSLRKEIIDYVLQKGIIEYNLVNNLFSLIKFYAQKEEDIEKLKTDNLLLAWFNENIKQEIGSFILLQDAYDSFNNWLIKRGNSAVSLRYFVSNFTNHKTFFDSNAQYKTKATVLKQYKQSYWHDPNHNLETRDAAIRSNYFLNIAFQTF